MTSLFGPIITGADVRAAAEATVRLWAPTYTAEIARQKSLTLPPIRSYGTGSGPSYPVDEIPACVIVAPGIQAIPDRRGDGRHDVGWALGVGIVCADPYRDVAIAQAEAYTGALRALILQNGSLGGFAEETTWVDEEVTQVGYDLERVIAAGSLIFEVRVANVVNRFGGLPTPPADPDLPSDGPQVATTEVTVTRST